MKIYERLKDGLRRTRDKLRDGFAGVFQFRRQIDDDVLEELEEVLFTADIGVEEVDRIMESLKAAYKEKKIEDTDQLLEYLKGELKRHLGEMNSEIVQAPSAPTVILIIGVNGSGKTTSIAKLSRRYKDEGKKVLLAACDTFRAAAIEQLEVWANRLSVDIVRHKTGSDPAAVAYDAAEAAVSRGADVMIIDTAGRLHTKEHLMRELEKIVRVLKKKIPEAPHESLLVLDATTGQNGLSQAKTFKEEIGLTGIILAKLDGTAKGGIVLAINNQLKLPVKFVGIGEKAEDFTDFDSEGFVDGMFEE